MLHKIFSNIKWQNDKNLFIGRVTAEVKVAEEKCNCRDKINCPLNDDCLVERLVYREKVEPTKGYKKVYIGSMEVMLEIRYNHKSSFNLPRYKKSTKPASYIWGKE